MPKQAILPMCDDGYARKKWNVQECRFLMESGLLEPGKYELIEGEIILKLGQSRIHIAIISKIISCSLPSSARTGSRTRRRSVLENVMADELRG